MACRTIRDDSGQVTAIACGRGPTRCKTCGKPSVALCDYPVIRNNRPATCDERMCQIHRHPVAGATDKDYCPTHHEEDRHETESRMQADRDPDQGEMDLTGEE